MPPPPPQRFGWQTTLRNVGKKCTDPPADQASTNPHNASLYVYQTYIQALFHPPCLTIVPCCTPHPPTLLHLHPPPLYCLQKKYDDKYQVYDKYEKTNDKYKKYDDKYEKYDDK